MRPTVWTKIPLGLLLLLAFAPAAGAEDIHVTVVTILATDKNTKINPKIECIARAVQAEEPKLTGFAMRTMTAKPIAIGAKDKFPLVEDQVAVVEVLEIDKDGKCVRLKVKVPMVGDITYTTCCNKFFPIVTPYVTKGGDRLIVAVQVARPCKDKK